MSPRISQRQALGTMTAASLAMPWVARAQAGLIPAALRHRNALGITVVFFDITSATTSSTRNTASSWRRPC